MKRISTLLFIVLALNFTAYSVTPRQGNWRWYANDGIETEATALANENVSIVITDSSELRIRINIFDYNNNILPENKKLTISLTSILNSSIIQAITIGDTNAFKMFDSEYITDGQTSINSLLSSNNSASFDSSYMYDTSIDSTVILNENKRLEVEYCIIPADSIKDLSKYTFKIPGISYTQDPVLYTLFSAKQSKLINNSPISDTIQNIKITASSGHGRCVFITEGDSSIVIPENDRNYSANSEFGVGDSIANSNWYCVFNSTSEENFNISRLINKKEYRAMIYEYYIIENDTIYMPDTTNNNIIFTAGMYPQTINFPAIPEKTYGDADFSAGASSNLGLDIAYASDNESVVTIVDGMVHIVSRGTANITASQAGNDTVSAAISVSKALIVNKLEQTIDFTGYFEKTYGDADFSAGAISSLGLKITYTSDDESVVTITDGIVNLVSVGNAHIIASQAGNDTVKEATSISKVIIVYKMDQTINFPAIPEKTYGDADFPTEASSSLGLEITYDIDNKSMISIVDGMIHIITDGTTNIRAFHIGNDTVKDASTTQQITVVYAANNINNLSADNIKIYPNPVINNKLHIEGMDSKSETTIQIFNINGKAVFINKIFSDSKEIDLSDFPKGMYFITLKSEMLNTSLKFVKE